MFIDADKEGYLGYLKAPAEGARGQAGERTTCTPPPDRRAAAITTDAGLETVFLNMHDAGSG